MRLRTRLFELQKDSMEDLAIRLGISLSYVYRIKKGERRINEKFIVGALGGFPEYKFEDLFYIENDVER